VSKHTFVCDQQCPRPSRRFTPASYSTECPLLEAVCATAHNTHIHSHLTLISTPCGIYKSVHLGSIRTLAVPQALLLLNENYYSGIKFKDFKIRLNKKKRKRVVQQYTELNRMFACIRRRQIIAANKKFSFQPLLERVERCCWCNRDWQAVPHPCCSNRESLVTDGGKTSRRNDKGVGSCWSQSSPWVKSWNRLQLHIFTPDIDGGINLILIIYHSFSIS